MAGTVYGKYLAVDLARMALKGLLTKTALSPSEIDYLYYGTVIQETRTSNIAREAAMGANIPYSVPSHTLSMACISSNACITAGAEKVRRRCHGAALLNPLLTSPTPTPTPDSGRAGRHHRGGRRRDVF